MWFVSPKVPNRSRDKNYSKQVLFWMLGITLILTVTHIGLQYLNLEIYNEKNGAIFELSNRFDFDDEASVMTWWAQLQFLLLAGICALALVLEKQKALKMLWLVPAGAALAFSIDETATLHEYILQRIHVAFFQDAQPTLLANSWVIVLPLIITAAVLLARIMFKYLPRQTIGLMCIGGAVFLGGAVLVDLITNGVSGSPFMIQGVLVATEEASELLGVSIVIYAVLGYIESSYGHRVSKAFRQLKSE